MVHRALNRYLQNESALKDQEQNLVEKQHGYQYEHAFSINWNAMKGYHYLMHLGHALNVLARYSEALAEVVVLKGVRGFICYIRDSLLHPWLEPEKVWIQQAIDAHKVVIGICLGAQLIADVLGGKVSKNEYKEIG